MDPDLLKVVSAFCGGVGGTHKELCGAFTGGVMALGKLFAPDTPGGDETRMRGSISRYRQRLLDEIGSLSCDVLTSTLYTGEDQGGDSCRVLVQRAVSMLLEVIAEFGGMPEPALNSS